jgi:hypothetical protein
MDATAAETPELLPGLREALLDPETGHLEAFLRDLRPQALLEIWYELDAEERERVLGALPPEVAANSSRTCRRRSSPKSSSP